MDKAEIYNLIMLAIAIPAAALIGSLLRAAKVAVDRWGERNDQQALAADLGIILDAVDREVVAGADRVRKMKDPGSLLWDPATRARMAVEARDRALAAFPKLVGSLSERGVDVRGAAVAQVEASVERLRTTGEKRVSIAPPAPVTAPTDEEKRPQE